MASQETFYSTDDNYTQRDVAVGESWSTIRDGDAAGSGGPASNSTYGFYFQAWTSANTWQTSIRGYTYFDNTIPSTATILSATLYIYGAAKYDGLSCTPNINLYSIESSCNYQTAGTTPFSTAIPYASWSTTGYNSFSLNSAGLAYITKNGRTYFSLRNASYDVANIEPNWVSNQFSHMGFWTVRKGTGYKPYIVIIYTTESGSSADNTIVTGLRHIYINSQEGERDDLEITFGGYSTTEDILAPDVTKIADEDVIPQPRFKEHSLAYYRWLARRLKQVYPDLFYKPADPPQNIIDLKKIKGYDIE